MKKYNKFNMSELSLPALAEASRIQENLEPIKQIDAALKACTFGRFHILLLAITFFGQMSACLVSASTGYLLPVAECDLHMTLLQKGLLNAMPYIGMLLSAVVAGFLTDAFGRKIFLVGGFTGQFVFTVLAASSQTYEVLLVAKFFEGLLFAMCFNPMLAMASEFCYNDIRDRVFLLQASFISICQIVIALMSWGILIQDWKMSFFGGNFVLNTWNFYLYAVSLWPLASCVMYGLFVPESPKYLVTQKKYDEARNILIKLYVQNTGKPAATYPFADIWKDKTKLAMENTENHVKNTFSHQIVTGLHNIKPMFRKPLGIYLALICTANFIIMSMYNVFRLWFPQMSAIVENYQSEESHNFCVMVDAYTNNLKAIQNATLLDVCVPTKSGNKTYINAIIIGSVSLVPYLVSGILVNKVGKKRLQIAIALSLRWASTTVAIVSLFSITIAISQLMMGLNQAFTVEVFGTTTRTLALSLMMVSGRIGTLTGNISFPVLLNMGCEIPFFTVGGLMAGVIILYIFMPSKK